MRSLDLSQEGQAIVDNALDRHKASLKKPGAPQAIIWWVASWSILAAVVPLVAFLIMAVQYPNSGGDNLILAVIIPPLCGGVVAWTLWSFSAEEYHRRKQFQREQRRQPTFEQHHAHCPNCRRAGAGEEMSRERIETGEVGYVTQHRQVPITDSLGRVTHHAQVPIREPYNKAVIRHTFRCRYCRHTWTHDEEQLPFL